MEKPHLLYVDLDGVAFDIVGPIVDRFGPPKHPVYSLEAAYPHVASEVLDEMVDDPFFYLRMEPLPGAVKMLQPLAYHFELRYVTARPRHVLGVSAVRLRECGFPQALITSVQDKAAYMIKHRPFAIIEDHAAIACAAAEMGICSIVLAAPDTWPYNHQGYGKAFFAVDWQDVWGHLMETRYGRRL